MIMLSENKNKCKINYKNVNGLNLPAETDSQIGFKISSFILFIGDKFQMQCHRFGIKEWEYY